MGAQCQPGDLGGSARPGRTARRHAGPSTSLHFGTIVFAAASACAAFVPTFNLLILCPAVQGAGGAFLLLTTVALVSAAFTGPRRGTALGTMGGIAAVADAAGPVIGGVLTATLGWPAVFLINLPLGAIAVIIALRAIPPDVDQVRAKRVDLAGAALLAVAIVARSLADWVSPRVGGGIHSRCEAS